MVAVKVVAYSATVYPAHKSVLATWRHSVHRCHVTDDTSYYHTVVVVAAVVGDAAAACAAEAKPRCHSCHTRPRTDSSHSVQE